MTEAADAADPALDAAFDALAHPTRRAVIALLRRAPLRSGELAAALSLPHPTTSRHLKVLRDAGLVDESPTPDDARVRVYHLCPAPFAALRGWLDEVEAFWGDQLSAFKAHAEAGARTAHPADDP
ncbi:MAG: metalloregulator ArsR/SmtB family transcription factor [Myxococcota bacterium]